MASARSFSHEQKSVFKNGEDSVYRARAATLHLLTENPRFVNRFLQVSDTLFLASGDFRRTFALRNGGEAGRQVGISEQKSKTI